MAHTHAGTPQPTPLLVGKQRQANGNGGVERELTGYRNVSNISAVSGASTIDAPQQPDSVEKERKSLPALLSEASVPPQQVFETSGLHGHGNEGGDERRDVFASMGFRPQEGAFGTPAPLTSAAP